MVLLLYVIKVIRCTYICSSKFKQKIRRESQQGSNKARLATCWRWANEKAFIIFSILWKFWRRAYQQHMYHIWALWPIYGAIINYTGWSINKVSQSRMKQLYLMKIRLNQHNILQADYYGLLHDFKNISSLTGRKRQKMLMI